MPVTRRIPTFCDGSSDFPERSLGSYQWDSHNGYAIESFSSPRERPGSQFGFGRPARNSEVVGTRKPVCWMVGERSHGVGISHCWWSVPGLSRGRQKMLLRWATGALLMAEQSFAGSWVPRSVDVESSSERESNLTETAGGVK
jgi:hypothetical protein